MSAPTANRNSTVALCIAAILASASTPVVADSAEVGQPTTGEEVAPTKTGEDAVELEDYVATGTGGDPVGVLPTEPVDSVFGFDKTLLETPRSVSVLSDDLMASYGIETALDVAKIVPSTFTTSIFGINGNVNIRGVASDTYFRGVKRLENTQLFPTPITAMSRLDVVRGPPSPLYGPGKVGGYTNFVPKSARAKTGKYLESPTGKAVVTLGSFDKKAGSAEVGGPVTVFGKRGGYYVYTNLEDSDTFYENVPFKQRILQSSFDYEINESLHLEFGQMYQYWGGTELAGWNRLTQELIDTGMYNAGTVAVNMDSNGDGLIATAEVDTFGPLLRTFAPGTPAATVAAGLGQGWQIDPATVRKVKIRRSANSQNPEDDGEAQINLGYMDLIYTLPDGSKLTNKLYGERMDRFKWTRASGYGQDTTSAVYEGKVMWEKAFAPTTSGFQLNFGASGLFRYYDTKNLSGTKYSDLVNRADLSVGFIQNNRFAVPNLENDLAPWNTGLSSRYTTKGFGSLIDATFRKANVVLGTRYDWVDIHSRIPSYVLTTPGLDAQGKDDGLSWSASASYEVFKGVRPYVTYARQETLVFGLDGGIGIPVVPNALNTAELREAGIKSSLFDNTMFLAVGGYRQTRTSFTADTQQVLSTLSTGVEAEMRWAVNSRLSVNAGGTWQSTKYTPLRPATISVNPTFFGLPDNYYGGRIQTTLTNDPAYAERSGYPDMVLNLNGTFFITEDLALNLSTSYQEEVASGRIKDITLPSAVLVGASLAYDTERFGFKLTVNNLTDQEYFTPNSPDGLGEVIVIPVPERNYQTTFTFRF
jgi:iron complex outermembrane recepter protein